MNLIKINLLPYREILEQKQKKQFQLVMAFGVIAGGVAVFLIWGALAGLAIAILIGWLIYQCGVRINLARFFKITGIFLILVAAGLFAGSFRALHEAGVWNIGQTIVADFSHVLHQDSPLGVILSGFFGYTDHPVVSDIVLYFLYLIPALTIFLKRNQS